MKRFSEYVITESIYYHGTASTCLSSILEKGLIPHYTPKDSNVAVSQNTGERLNCVYLTKSLACAREYATNHPQGKPVILSVNIPTEFEHNLATDEAETNGVPFRGHVPADWITPINIGE